MHPAELHVERAERVRPVRPGRRTDLGTSRRARTRRSRSEGSSPPGPRSDPRRYDRSRHGAPQARRTRAQRSPRAATGSRAWASSSNGTLTKVKQPSSLWTKPWTLPGTGQSTRRLRVGLGDPRTSVPLSSARDRTPLLRACPAHSLVTEAGVSQVRSLPRARLAARAIVRRVS
jgi:hypothetical protein